MPWTIKNPPSPAKNWGLLAKRRCVRAANTALKEGKSEQQAIFACIGASGKSYKQVDEEGYEESVEDALVTFQEIMTAYFAGLITLSVLSLRFKEAIEIHVLRLMVLGLNGQDPTQADIDFAQGKIDKQTGLFDVFIADLAVRDITENRALWRAGLYATDRETYIFYTVPNAVVSLMEGLPGEICLGKGLCGCFLDVSFDAEGNAAVHWVVDPVKESCEVCLGMQSRSPFLFSREQLESG